ncbi:MAG TPA: aminotransferase class I/II-fold pyridoxal phosphate-dependent enzyme [Gemmatimonadales bacterium]
MALRAARVIGTLGTEAALDVLTAARQLEARGRSVRHLEVGQPDAPTAPHVVETAVAALRAGRTGYAPPAGLPALRSAIAERWRALGAAVDPDRVVVTPGGKPMLAWAATLVLEPGDEALIPDPGFPIYASAVRFAGGRPVTYPLDTGADFTLDPDAIAERIGPRTRLLYLNVPHNPTGGTATPAALDRVADLAERYDLIVVADDVYRGLRYDGPDDSIFLRPGLPARTILVDAFSKRYAMTGWRLGYGILPPVLVDGAVRLVINSVSCVPPFVQEAGVAALTGPQDAVTTLRERLRHIRDIAVRRLHAVPGVSCGVPGGAFYLFPDVSALLPAGESVAALASDLLDGSGVALLPGTAFGPGGAGHLRISYARPLAELTAAFDALEAALSRSPAAVQEGS